MTQKGETKCHGNASSISAFFMLDCLYIPHISGISQVVLSVGTTTITLSRRGGNLHQPFKISISVYTAVARSLCTVWPCYGVVDRGG